MEPNTNENLFDLQVDQLTGYSFKEAAKWGRFIAIVYAVIVGLIVLALTLSGAAFSTYFEKFLGNAGEVAGMLGGALLVIIGVVVLIVAVVTILLFRFAQQVKAGMEQQEQALFNKGLKSLKYYFIVYGIIAIISFLSVLGITITTLFITNNQF
jgi:high-affinity nickel permease